MSDQRLFALVWSAMSRWPRGGAVFTAQCSYLVIGAGVGWAMLLLDERLQPLVWAALAVTLAGVALVQPRPAAQAGPGE